MDQKNIRNFSIIAHIDHGKSTLADRMLELTHTIEKRQMREQFLDSMELERERGITIKMKPVRMIYRPDRRLIADGTQKDAEPEFLYKELTYRIRGILFEVRKKIGLGHKEQVYQGALEIEFAKAGLRFESKKNISIKYEGKNIGLYQPDFVVEDKVLLELKALPEIARTQTEQVWSYLKGCSYKLALLVNFGSKDLEIKRVVYDTARENSAPLLRNSASSLRSSAGVSNQVENEAYILNLIDTPGHIDFYYEVSRALKAVEGVVLLVDATQGVQAQTLTTLRMAQEAGLVILPVVSKIDSPIARTQEVKQEVARVVGCKQEDVLLVSGKTGEGVDNLLQAIIKRVPPPVSSGTSAGFRGLIFDFHYSNHTGVIVFLRVFDGSVTARDAMKFCASDQKFSPIEVGIFSPGEVKTETLSAGEIGYITTGIKQPGIASVGDTVTSYKHPLPALSGYEQPKPVVWASVYPESQNDFDSLRQALSRLKLSDSSLSFEEENSGALGRGFRCGFLGMLHLEIVTERLRREFNLELVVTSPSVIYEIELKNEKKMIAYSPMQFPDHGQIMKVYEPLAEVKIITPSDYLGFIMTLLYDHEAQVTNTETWSDSRTAISLTMPLRELMRNFFDEIKSVTSGFASLSYTIKGNALADVVRLDLLVAEEIVPAFSRIVSRKRLEHEAEASAEKLYKILPKQLFVTKIQSQALGRIISSRRLSALKKDVTGYLYGGDITRKRKLWEKQKKGKKKLLARGRVNISHDVFLKMVQK